MSSEKSGRTIYVVAASLIIVGTAVGVFQIVGGSLELSVESGPVFVPMIGLLSLLLWIVKPERRIVEHLAIRYAYKKEELRDIKVRMASSLLYVRPWESSPKDASTIEESLRNDLERILRSPEFREQIDNYMQAFWLVLLTPFSLGILALFYPVPFWGLALLGTAMGCLLALLLLEENPETLTRVLEYSFARWFHESASMDLSRRESGFAMKSNVAGRLKAMLEIVAPTIDLAVRGDWKGFDRKIGNLDRLIVVPDPRVLTWSEVDDHLGFLQWCIGQIHGVNGQLVDTYLKNAGLQVTDSIAVLRGNRNWSFSEEEEIVASTTMHVVGNSTDRDVLLHLDAGFYEGFQPNVLAKLTDLSRTILGEVPFTLNQQPVPRFQGGVGQLEQVAWLIVAAAERGFLDVSGIMRILGQWHVDLLALVGAIGPRGAKVILEEDLGLPLDNLRRVANHVGKVLRGKDLTDPSKVYKRLMDLRKTNPSDIVQTYATELAGRRVPLETPREPTTGLEAVSRFYNDMQAEMLRGKIAKLQ